MGSDFIGETDQQYKVWDLLAGGSDFKLLYKSKYPQLAYKHWTSALEMQGILAVQNRFIMWLLAMFLYENPKEFQINRSMLHPTATSLKCFERGFATRYALRDEICANGKSEHNCTDLGAQAHDQCCFFLEKRYRYSPLRLLFRSSPVGKKDAGTEYRWVSPEKKALLITHFITLAHNKDERDKDMGAIWYNL